MNAAWRAEGIGQMGKLTNQQPQEVFRYFEEICAIPHGSGNTRQISDYLAGFAKELGLRYLQDACGNVIIWKDGTAEYENSPAVMLQGHMDMVCEKEPGCPLDLARDGLQLRLEDGIISAEGTTLGGDDGIAVAYALAILASDTIPHPPLEAVFTVDEEIGMLGAAALDTAPLRAKYMLNIDSEDEGVLLVSCAGGTTAVCHLPVVRETAEGVPAVLSVSGCLGGHSGVEIDKGRANATQVLGRILCRISRAADFRIVSADGGKKDNAIPAESSAELLFEKDADWVRLRSLAEEVNRELQAEYAATDPGIVVRLEAEGKELSTPAQALTRESTRALITALYGLPGGIQRMSFDIEGLAQTSLNMGILETDGDEVRMSFSVRSSVESEKQELVSRMECLMRSLGGNVTHSGDYPAWEYQKESRLRSLMAAVFEEQYGHQPVIQAIHAGVECGLFAGKMPGLDCVSFGPDMKDIHTPRETMDVASAARTWDYLLEVLRRLR